MQKDSTSAVTTGKYVNMRPPTVLWYHYLPTSLYLCCLPLAPQVWSVFNSSLVDTHSWHRYFSSPEDSNNSTAKPAWKRHIQNLQIKLSVFDTSCAHNNEGPPTIRETGHRRFVARSARRTSVTCCPMHGPKRDDGLQQRKKRWWCEWLRFSRAFQETQ